MIFSAFFLQQKYPPGTKIDDYTIIRMLGDGKNAIRFLAEKMNQKYVLVFPKSGLLKRKNENADGYLDVLVLLDNGSIPKWMDMLSLEGMQGFVLEYIEGRTLEQMITKEKRKFDRDEIHDICRKLIDIISYLHNQDIAHRNIRISNVIMNGTDVYLVDFEQARFIDRKTFKADIDFSCLGDLMIQLYNSSYEKKRLWGKPWGKTWGKELGVPEMEWRFLRKLKGLDARYRSVREIQHDFSDILKQSK